MRKSAAGSLHPAIKRTLVSMGIAAVYAVVSVVLIEAVSAPALPVLIVGAAVTWIVIMVVVIRMGLRARRARP
jgi:hypothetical protein